MAKLLKTLLFFIFLLTTSAWPMFTTVQDSSGSPYDIHLDTQISPSRVPLNRTTLLSVRIEWEDGMDRIEIEDVEEPVLSNLDIVGTSTGNRIIGTATGEKSVKVIGYTLQPENLGMGYVESVILTYRDKLTGETHVMSTRRVGVEVISPVPEEGAKSNSWMWILGFGLLILFILTLIFRFLSHRKSEVPDEPRPIIEELYLNKIKG